MIEKKVNKGDILEFDLAVKLDDETLEDISGDSLSVVVGEATEDDLPGEVSEKLETATVGKQLDVDYSSVSRLRRIERARQPSSRLRQKRFTNWSYRLNEGFFEDLPWDSLSGGA